MRMKVRGENALSVAEGANVLDMNLSGKKTRAGRTSGERYTTSHQRR